MDKNKHILLITTGGTIAGLSAKNIGEVIDADDFQKIIDPTVNRIEKISGLKATITPEPLWELDSSDILPKHWKVIGDVIYREYDHYDAFIVTHGTNTLGYTSSALSFTFENLNKPVVLTGSQVSYGFPGSDALMNLENAVRVAIGPQPPPINGVCTVFGSHIITGARVKKTTEFDYDAFQSFTTSSLGRIGREITINEANLEKHYSYLRKSQAPAVTAKDLIVKNNFDTRIVSLSEFPGMSPNFFETQVENNDTRGFILRAFGAGDASTHLKKGFEYLKANKIPIVVTSQAPNGVSNFRVNRPGQLLKNEDLAIPAWDMNIESQTVKLSWLLGQNLSYEDIKRIMVTDLKGEINVKSRED